VPWRQGKVQELSAGNRLSWGNRKGGKFDFGGVVTTRKLHRPKRVEESSFTFR